MKRTILTLLFLLLAAPAFSQDVGYYIRADCGSLSPAPYNTVCEQSTTVSGRSAGQLYVYDGATWVSVTASSSGGHVIKDEGTSRPQRTNLNFAGAGVSCIDDSGNDETECTIDTGGAPPFDTITSGTNSTATMTVGTGGSIAVSGSGSVTATTFPANPANCSAGSGASGITAAGVAETCVDFLEEPSGTGVVVKSAANTSLTRTITGVTGNITCTNGDGVAGNPTCDLGSTAVQTDQANTYGAFNQDYTSGILTLPNSAGATPASNNQIAVDTTAGTVNVKIGGTVYSLATTLGTFTSFAADPAGCTLADGTWTNDIDASGVSNCVAIHSSGAAAPTAGTVRFVGEVYQDTRAYNCSTQTGLTYIGQAVGGNFTPVLAQPDGYTTITGDSGSASPCGSDTFKIEGSTTVVSTVTSGSPDKVVLTSKLITHATDCTAVATGSDGQACFEQDSDRIFVCEPTAGLCDTAGEWKLATGAGGSATPGGSVNDIQVNDGASGLAGGRGTLDGSGNLAIAGTGTFGSGSGVSSFVTYAGVTSGSSTWGAADIAGTPARVDVPIATGAANTFLMTNGATPQQTAWTALTTTHLPAAAKIRPCQIAFGDPGASSAVLQDDNDAPSVCKNSYGATLTITAVHCYAPTGAPTVRPIVTGGAADSILSAAITCSTTAGGVVGTLNGTPTLSANGTIDVNITSAGGVAKYLVIYITMTL